MSDQQFPCLAETRNLTLGGFGREQGPEPRLQLAANALVEAAIRRYPQIIPNTQNVVRGMTGNGMTTAEVTALTKHVIDDIGPIEAIGLDGIKAGTPLMVTRRQMKTIEKIIERLPVDQIGTKARHYFEDARRRGAIRVR